MKRQLNFWSKMRGLSDSSLVNTSLSIEDKKFIVIFRRPGSVEPIDQITIDLSNEEALEMKQTFELCGASVFQDEMDEKIYFAHIATQRENVKRLENTSVYMCWLTIVFVICVMVSALLLKLSVILTLCISLFISILVGFLIRKKVMKNE